MIISQAEIFKRELWAARKSLFSRLGAAFTTLRTNGSRWRLGQRLEIRYINVLRNKFIDEAPLPIPFMNIPSLINYLSS